MITKKIFDMEDFQNCFEILPQKNSDKICTPYESGVGMFCLNKQIYSVAYSHLIFEKVQCTLGEGEREDVNK